VRCDALEPFRPGASRHFAENAMPHRVRAVLVAAIVIRFFALATLVVQKGIELQKRRRLGTQRAGNWILQPSDPIAHSAVEESHFDGGVGRMRLQIGAAQFFVVPRSDAPPVVRVRPAHCLPHLASGVGWRSRLPMASPVRVVDLGRADTQIMYLI
jgi:hypothetical protein